MGEVFLEKITKVEKYCAAQERFLYGKKGCLRIHEKTGELTGGGVSKAASRSFKFKVSSSKFQVFQSMSFLFFVTPKTCIQLS
jgi:hypothetical protein